MVNEEAVVTERSLSKIKKVCKFIGYAMKIILVLFCISWVAVAAIMISTIVGFSGQNGIETIDVSNLLLFLAYGVVFGVTIVVLTKVFSDTARGETPFAMIQVKRLRLIALMLIIYAALDIFTVSNTASLQFNGVDSGFISTNENSFLAVNFTPIIAAAVLFAFSFVFKYGVLLQELSDETL